MSPLPSPLIHLIWPSWPERAYMDVLGEREGNNTMALTRF